MTDERYQMELELLKRKLPANIFKFDDKRSLTIAAMTNSGNVYTLRFEFAYYPSRKPRVYVLNPLRMRNGATMPACSSQMHTLEGKNGWTQICHEGTSWTPQHSIYKVYVRCRLWLELYEAHLRSGKPLDYYLKHDI